MTRGTAIQILLMGFMLAGVGFVLFWVVQMVKQLLSKQGRKEFGYEVKTSAHFVVEERKYFLKEFRVTLVIFGILAFALLVGLLD